VAPFLGRSIAAGEKLTLCRQHRRAFETEFGVTAQIDESDDPAPTGWRSWIDIPQGILSISVALVVVVLAQLDAPMWLVIAGTAVAGAIGIFIYSRWLKARS
jgi:hypothetical protein